MAGVGVRALGKKRRNGDPEPGPEALRGSFEALFYAQWNSMWRVMEGRREGRRKITGVTAIVQPTDNESLVLSNER